MRHGQDRKEVIQPFTLHPYPCLLASASCSLRWFYDNIFLQCRAASSLARARVARCVSSPYFRLQILDTLGARNNIFPARIDVPSSFSLVALLPFNILHYLSLSPYTFTGQVCLIHFSAIIRDAYEQYRDSNIFHRYNYTIIQLKPVVDTIVWINDIGEGLNI